MKFKKLIERNLLNAFKIAGDLVSTITYTEGLDSSFDFSTGVTSNTLYVPPRNDTARCFITKRTTKLDGTVAAELLIKGDIPVTGTEVKIGNTAWRVTGSKFESEVVAVLSLVEVSSG